MIANTNIIVENILVNIFERFILYKYYINTRCYLNI